MKWVTKVKRLRVVRDNVESAARSAATCYASREEADGAYREAMRKHAEAVRLLESEVLRIERLDTAARTKVTKKVRP